MNLFSVLGDLVNWLGSLLPRWGLVRSTEAGVVFHRKGQRILKGPRLFWWLPCISEVEIVPVVRQVIDLIPQTLMTKEGKSVIAGAIVVYAVADVHKYLVENHDAERSLAEVANAALREAIVSKTLAEIQENDRKTMDNALTRAAKDHLAEFGVEIERMRLTDFSTAQIVNYVGAPLGMPPQEETEE